MVALALVFEVTVIIVPTMFTYIVKQVLRIYVIGIMMLSIDASSLE